MKVKTMISLLALLFVMNAGAQEARNQVITAAVNNVQYTKKEVKQTAGKVIGEVLSAVVAGQSTQQVEGYEEAIRAAIVKGLSQARRIKCLDGKLTPEEAAQTNTCYVDAVIANVSTTSKVETHEDSKKNKYSRTYYRGVIGVTLHLKDSRTDEVISSPSFNVSASDLSWMESPEGALNNALTHLANDITERMNISLPLKANILEGAREKKDKQKEVYIDLGSSEGGFEGLHFDVFTVKTVAGREAKKKIGRLKIKDVEGDDISLCKVQSGGRDIKAALDAGEQLLIITTD